MKAQDLRILDERQAAIAEVAIDFVACGNGLGFAPNPLGELLHRGGFMRLRRGWDTQWHDAADALFDALHHRQEIPAPYRLEQLETATGAAAAAMVVTFAILVGEE